MRWTDANIVTFGPPQSFNEITSASVTAIPAPEPSSLILLGTRVLSVAGTLRRRFNS